MSSNNSNALVPVKNGNLPAVIKKIKDVSSLSLVNENVYLADKKAVREQLPDILGRVLARIWIDQKFHRSFSEDPQGTLQLNGVFLPESMDVEFQKPDSSRPRIVVYERRANSKFRTRIFYLQLVMMAGR
tara:strand:- start:1628 stop:2017 length:390 start_codon:yes stop_codon:yes gene_type:complete